MYAAICKTASRSCLSCLMRGLLSCCLLCLLLSACQSASRQGEGLPYYNTALPLEVRVKDLIDRMTLEEKLSQMQYNAPAIERLGVSAFYRKHSFSSEADTATIFPQPVGLAASWNRQLLQEVATVVSDEARANYKQLSENTQEEAGQKLLVPVPYANIWRDPRWSEGKKTYGEDPYLAGKLMVSYLKGLQGEDARYLKTVATARHYALHSGPQAVHHHMDVQASKQDLHESYLPVFEAAVREGRVPSVMCAGNRFEGEPCCGSNLLLQSILRNQWQFKGYVVSACGAIENLSGSRQLASTPEQAAALSVNRGTDLSCDSTFSLLKEAVAQGLVSETKIDQALYRLFEVRFRLGMFDLPGLLPWKELSAATIHHPEHQALALQAARESIVLLKNRHKLLPLNRELASIAVIGPNARHPASLLGRPDSFVSHAITPLQGITAKLGENTRVYYAEGVGFAEGFPALHLIPAEVLASEDGPDLKKVLAKPLVLPEDSSMLVLSDSVIDFGADAQAYPLAQHTDSLHMGWSGYLRPRHSGRHWIGLEAAGAVRLFLKDSLYLEYATTGEQQLRYFPIDLEKGKKYRLAIDYQNHKPAQQLRLLWAEPDDCLEREALEAARKAEVVVMIMGLTPYLEQEKLPVHVDGFARGDRSDIRMPAVQERLIRSIAALGKPVVLVLLGGSTLAFQGVEQYASAVLQAWEPGEKGGEALADVLFGDYNPSGRLPVTMYSSLQGLPAFEDYRMDSRTYKFYREEPLYPFGYGLSYTQFAYRELHMPDSAAAGDTLSLSVVVTNTGAVAGHEVVQLYVTDLQASVRAPLRSLQGFEKVWLEPGESRKVTFDLAPRQLGVVTEGGNLLIEAGALEISVGGQQPHLPAKFSERAATTLSDTVWLYGDSVLL